MSVSFDQKKKVVNNEETVFLLFYLQPAVSVFGGGGRYYVEGWGSRGQRRPTSSPPAPGEELPRKANSTVSIFLSLESLVLASETHLGFENLSS